MTRVNGYLITCYLITLMLCTIGCAEPQPTVNRVQANALAKSIFVDSEWYFHKTIIDTPYSNPAMFVGDGGELHKIQWDVEEDYLIARATRQHISHSEDVNVSGEGANKYSMVAMYAIESHFDIRRAYNPTTGEEMNVIEENTEDRVWYEREYMRVNWSENLVSETDLMGAMLFGGSGGSIEPVAFWIQEPDHPWAPKFEENEDGEIYYIDIVNKFFATPGTVVVGGIMGVDGVVVPECMLLSNQHRDCNPGEIAVRNSFLRVEPDRDYQPKEWTEDRQFTFGFFTSWMDEYDRDYKVKVDNRLRLINRHNIWQESHQREDGEYVWCTSDEQCGGEGAKCDMTLARAKLWEEGACTIPYRDREVRQIAYHLSWDFPEDMLPDAYAMEDSWNEAYVDTVDSMRALECMTEGGSREKCDASEKGKDDAKEIFVLCHNPVKQDDPESCGPVGTVAELGDIRYNLLAWVHEPHLSSPLGYGPSNCDPETGEIISAHAHIYGAGVDTAAAFARDLLALLNGDLKIDNLRTNGTFGRWIDKATSRSFEPVNREAERHVVPLDGADAKLVNQTMSFDWLEELVDSKGQSSLPLNLQNFIGRYKKAAERTSRAVGELRMGDRAQSRMRRFKDNGRDIEELMTTDEIRMTAGFDPKTPMNDEVLKRSSRFRGLSLAQLRALEEMRRKYSNRNNTCIMHGNFMDEGLLGLAQEIHREGKMSWFGVEYDLKDKEGNIDYDLVTQMLRHPIFNAVAIHEVGHTIGLMHNFSGSYDSFNYMPGYWDLRKKDGPMKPRAWDPMTEEEIKGRIREYQYSTVMDYGHNYVVTDAKGIGLYDRAAIKMGYGDIREVLTNVRGSTGLFTNEDVMAMVAASRGFGIPGVFEPNAFVSFVAGLGDIQFIPYTQIPGLAGGIEEGIYAREDMWYEELSAAGSGPASQLLQMFSSGIANIGNAVKINDSEGRPVVPYYTCSDEFANIQPNCQQWDAGADEYEAIQSMIDSYWNYYPLDHFMRQSIGFNPNDVAERMYSRYFSRFENANLMYSFFRGTLSQLGATDAFFESETGLGAFTVGVGAAYEILTRAATTPEDGTHYRVDTLDGDKLFTMDSNFAGIPVSGAGPSINIDYFNGRSLRTGYSFGPEMSYFFLERAGYFFDKTLAMETLMSPGMGLIATDTVVDIRDFQVSFYTTFREPLTAFMRGAIANDWNAYAPRWLKDTKELIFPNPAEQLSGEMERGGVLVDPALEFSLQLYAMVYGTTMLPRTFDQSFNDLSRLWVKGGAEGVDLELTEGQELIEFRDEDSGLVYVAPSYPDEAGKETGIAAKMLLHAKKLEEDGSSMALALWMDNINVLRRLTWMTGFGGDGRYVPDDETNPLY
ncbi:MAG: hypothetical protein GY847_05400 [Proteobacteria bacterium]|nr:hypothetical protein [Pseudomonadota bacterium]